MGERDVASFFFMPESSSTYMPGVRRRPSSFASQLIWSYRRAELVMARQTEASGTRSAAAPGKREFDPERAPPDCCGEPITFVHSSKAYYCIVLERLRPVFLFFDDKGRRRKTKKKFILNVHMDIDSGSLDICLLLSVYLCSYLYELL